LASPRGTWRACQTCQVHTTPAAVQAPYARREAAAQRQVKSQAERDLEAIALEDRKGPMLDQLDALENGGKLDTASLRKIRRFREWVDCAQSDARLDELVELFRQAGIRPRRWWHGKPAPELESAESAYDDDGQATDDYGAKSEHAPAAKRTAAVDYAAELAARNWIMRPHGAGTCHIIEQTPHGWTNTEPQQCAPRAGFVIPGGAVCNSHYRALTTALDQRSA